MQRWPDTSISPSATEPCWPVSWPPAPRLVAEAFRPVGDPLRTGLMAGPAAEPSAVARALAASLAPEEFEPKAWPAWLLPGQRRGVRRVLAALTRFGGALLADPVGSAKTYVALAVASALARSRPGACLVPAPLVAQWRAIAARLGVAVEVGSHQQASRGRLPSGTAGLVVVDESQHFRNPATRRYAHTAPWLAGRPVLLLSATPIVNRLDDLAHQLLLAVRDDALAAEGVPSLRAALASGYGPPALGRLVVEEQRAAGPRPQRTLGRSEPGSEECEAAGRMVRAIGALRLSRHPPTAALIRGVLIAAAASSPAALAGALRRYRALLLHARDARASGLSPGRAELRRFAGELDDQLVLWGLVQTSDADELALDDLDDLPNLTRAIASDWADPKLERLREIVADGVPSLVFASRRETVRHLRDGLAPPAVAWCSGERAGLGTAPAPRSAVLSWFTEAAPSAWRPPTCLVVTDVAAEGLDLRRARRVVHYDLPWTPTRMEQREGRALRLNSSHREVEIIHFRPPPPYEAALRTGERLLRKAALPARAGLGAAGRRLWRWRSELADEIGVLGAVRGMAVVRAGPRGVLAGFELYGDGAGARGSVPLSSTVGWLDPFGTWSETPELVVERLRAALGTGAIATDRRGVAHALDALAPIVRARLALAAARRWSAVEPEPAARQLAATLQAHVAAAARARDGAQLARLERALAFVAGGHTAGEAMLVRRLAAAGPLQRTDLERLPPPTAAEPAVGVRITGIVLFDGGEDE